MKTATKILISVGVFGAIAAYFVTRPNIDVRLTDNLNKLVTFQFDGKEITYKLGTTAMGYSTGSYTVEVRSINTTAGIPGIQITAKKKDGSIYQQRSIYFQ